MSETAETPTKYAYEKLMAEHKLEFKDLPEDAKIGIETIKNIDKMVKLNEKKGKAPSPAIVAKIKANDKWVVNEILDFIGEKDTNTEEIPHDAEEVIADIKEEIEEQEQEEQEEEGSDTDDNKDAADDNKDADDDADDSAKPIALSEEAKKALAATIETELTEMFNSGKTEWKVDEIKAKFKNTYNTIFDTYEDDAENGIMTTNFSLIETGEEIFTISKL